MALMDDPKLVIIGDGAIGKTCLVARFNADGFKDDYEPTMFDDQPFDLLFDDPDDFTSTWQRFLDDKGEAKGVENDKKTLSIWDTAGQESMEALRELAYPKTHVILLGYNTSHPESLENAETTWQEELTNKAAKCGITKNAPCILVGTMSDKRDEEAAAGKSADTYVTAKQGYAAAKSLGCCAFIETSAKADTGCSECLDLAVKAAFTYASSLDVKEETQANPLKIEDFVPKATVQAAGGGAQPPGGGAAADGGGAAADGGGAAADGGANTTTPAKTAPAKTVPPQKPRTGTGGSGKDDTPKDASGCCVIA